MGGDSHVELSTVRCPKKKGTIKKKELKEVALGENGQLPDDRKRTRKTCSRICCKTQRRFLRAKTVFLQFLLNRFDLRPKLLVVMENLENPREHQIFVKKHKLLKIRTKTKGN